MASRRNRRTLKRQSKRVRGGNEVTPPAQTTNNGMFSSLSSLWSWGSKPPSTATPSTATPSTTTPGGGKRMRKTSKRQSRR